MAILYFVNIGHEYPAIVEFAPSQKIPKKSRSRKDVKCGTIDDDPDYLKFVEILQNPTKSTRTVQQCLEDIDAREKEQKSMYLYNTFFNSIFVDPLN